MQLLLVTSVASAPLWAANKSFVGDWKLDPSKSKSTDQMKVESVGGNKYAFELGGGPEIVVPNGTDQPGLAGTTLSVSVEGPDSWKVVRKQEGRVLLTAYWKLSEDGNTLTDDFTQFEPNGASSNAKLVFKRTGGTSGFAGTWEKNSETVNSPYVIKVQAYEGDGLSFINSSQGITRNVTFDGKNHPLAGTNAPSGVTSSARRVSEHILEITTRFNGEVVGTQEDALSPDGKTLTLTIHVPGRTAPNILVFERQ
ncbi:MAG TPA: hypothetical protein VET66_07640 [Steroidobacteraceae bacterium]|nr:hypothetical protein [Steroidobacteraceae bacterium]